MGARVRVVLSGERGDNGLGGQRMKPPPLALSSTPLSPPPPLPCPPFALPLEGRRMRDSRISMIASTARPKAKVSKSTTPDSASLRAKR